MGNTVTRSSIGRTVAQNATASASNNVQPGMQQNESKRRRLMRAQTKTATERSNTDYANDLRPSELGRAPPVTERTAPRAKPLPSYFGGRDTLEKVREQLRYQSDLDRFQSRLGVPCKTACGHSFCRPTFCSCDAYRRFTLLGKTAGATRGTDTPLPFANKNYNKSSGNDDAADMRTAYDRESATLAKQIAVTNKQLAQQRNGSLYDGAQQAVRGANAVARRPVASIEVERAVRKNSNAQKDA